MVALVVVSHSRALARAAVELARQMVPGGEVTIEIAAGLDEQTLGTDATAIAAAIEAAADHVADRRAEGRPATDHPEGVVVLMDLGGAVLAAEFALELLEPAVRDRVLLCAAPLVEGLVVAAVTAAGGAAAGEVAAEASSALAGKQAQLGVAPTGIELPAAGPAGAGPAAMPDTAAPVVPTGGDSGAPVSESFELRARHGLHARPAALLVTAVRAWDAEVQLRNLTTGAGPVNAASLSQVATLGALQGHRVQVAASGRQAREAVEAVLALADRGFDDPLDDVTPGSPASGSAGLDDGPRRGALPASAGIGIGPAHRFTPARRQIPDVVAADPAVELDRLTAAFDAARREIEAVSARVADPGQAQIFAAHLLLLDDPALVDAVRRRISAGQGAAAAWNNEVEATAARFDQLADPYLNARAADIRAVGDQVLDVLLPGSQTALDPALDGVVIAADLTPAQVASIGPGQVAALVLAGGSPTAHSVILARGKAIPVVVAAGPGVLEIPEGTVVVVDGGTGELVVDPAPTLLRSWRERAGQQRRTAEQAARLAHSPAVTRDGVPIVVAANLGSVADAIHAAENGADAAGLVRTEFVFLERDQAPSVAEQEEIYLAMAQALGGRRITLRTLDVGGDKPLSYLPMPPEANPFLGLRGLRLGLARPQVLEDQLRAMVRVARQTPVSVMFPMVSTVAEVRAARHLLDGVIRSEGHGRPPGLQVGIMVEVPAAALKSAALAAEVDFFSIGTNDLTQYTLAAERGNQGVAELGTGYDPAVLALIRQTCMGAQAQAQAQAQARAQARAGTGVGPVPVPVPVAVCGELAADERAVGLLIGLGVRELSVAAGSVPLVKAAVRAVDAVAAEALAEAALRAPGPDEVRRLPAGW